MDGRGSRARAEESGPEAEKAAAGELESPQRVRARRGAGNFGVSRGGGWGRERRGQSGGRG